MFQGAPGAENVISVKAIGHYEHEQEIVKKKESCCSGEKREFISSYKNAHDIWTLRLNDTPVLRTTAGLIIFFVPI